MGSRVHLSLRPRGLGPWGYATTVVRYKGAWAVLGRLPFPSLELACAVQLPDQQCARSLPGLPSRSPLVPAPSLRSQCTGSRRALCPREDGPSVPMPQWTISSSSALLSRSTTSTSLRGTCTKSGEARESWGIHRVYLTRLCLFVQRPLP